MYEEVFEKLSKSKFRSKFKLKESDRQYIEKKSLSVIKSHAEDFISQRIAPPIIKNDGKQTPMKGHPVFIAQHATATCCRGCISKWHKFPRNVELTSFQQKYLVDLIMAWIEKQL